MFLQELGINTELFQWSLCSSSCLKPLRLFCLLSAPWWFYPEWGIMAPWCLVQPERSLGLFILQPFRAANQSYTSVLSLLLEIIIFIYFTLINWKIDIILYLLKRIRWKSCFPQQTSTHFGDCFLPTDLLIHSFLGAVPKSCTQIWGLYLIYVML